MNVLSRGLWLPFAIACSAAPGRADTLDAVLERLDASARQFHSFSAHIKRTDFTAVLNESEVMSGGTKMKRGKSGVTGVMEFTEPNPHTIAIAGHTVQRYYPKASVVEIYDTTKFAAVRDEYLLLGFGTPVAELRKDYDLKLGGSETVDSVKATRIELTPKSAEMLKYIRKIELWVPDGQSNPVQEKITEPSKDTILVLYSDVMVNPPIPDSAFELKLPPNVRRLNPKK